MSLGTASGDAATFVGFDSAWADNARAPGAICSVRFENGRFVDFRRPELVGFDAAARFIHQAASNPGPTLVALDQPTIVRNADGMRPVEKVVASLVSWVGGGVQPSNRSRTGFFDDAAPIWRFRATVPMTEDPLAARTTESGLHVLEVFPALALISLSEGFCGRLRGPRYNPSRRKTFSTEHWIKVTDVVAAEAGRLGCPAAAEWLLAHSGPGPVRKSDQDRLDAVICMMIAIRWRRDPPGSSAMIGDLDNGYIVTPISAPAHERLKKAAAKHHVPILP